MTPRQDQPHPAPHATSTFPIRTNATPLPRAPQHPYQHLPPPPLSLPPRPTPFYQHSSHVRPTLDQVPPEHHLPHPPTTEPRDHRQQKQDTEEEEEQRRRFYAKKETVQRAHLQQLRKVQREADIGLLEMSRNKLAPEVQRALFVKNLSYNVSSEELFDLFGKFGPIRQIRQGIANNTKGTAFVVYEDVMDAKTACDKLNGFNFQNRYLVVLYHQPEKMARHEGELQKRREELEKLKKQHGIE